ncbi:four helix bundle protein [Candidatus Woesearchaeota archaeon]|nr:MAG: S23 ribosomal [archaeon GW2011_AR18]MBS3161333.1 four helix bundle protein [Candidatus Woesearchaeota archaeon]HIH25364.1 four helix bundle protein [Nanoarchaeota archaeon]
MTTNFHNLEVWQIGYELVLDFYKITEKFPESEKNNIISQIKRASVSIPLNIAEGSTRSTSRAYSQFLNYSYGSIKELEVLLMLSRDLKYINDEEYKIFFEKLDILSRKLYSFINIINNERIY